MRSANYLEMTTTSIAGTLGDGAVTCTAQTSMPDFTAVFTATKRWVRYFIEDTVNKKFETGVGSVASNVLTRTKVQVTWDGTTYKDGSSATAAALQFGSSPTTGNIRIRLSPTSEAQSPLIIDAANTSIAGDSNWRDYNISAHISWGTTGSAGSVVTANREYYQVHCVTKAGLLAGWQFDVTTAVAASNLAAALYDVGSDGLPGSKIVDFVTTATTSTGVKTDTATGSWSPATPVWMVPGWYYIGHISGHAIALKGSNVGTLIGGSAIPTPLGRQGGYGYGCQVYVGGTYPTLPSSPSLAGGTMASPNAPLGGTHWFGLKITP